MTPSADKLRDAAQVNLDRHPDTAAARAFVGAVQPCVVAHLDRTRPMGAKGLATLTGDLGAILAGIMRPGVQGSYVRANRRPGAPMWERAPIGRDRFWRLADALGKAGLVEHVNGGRAPGRDLDGRGGNPAALRPLPSLIDLATSQGCTGETRKADWRVDAALRAAPVDVTDAQLVSCLPVKGVPMTLADDMQATLAGMRRDLRAANALNARADIRGAGQTVWMVRRFRHSPMFGGRFYAPHVTLSEDERAAITIDGEAVAEVDVKASQLTILLGITGQAEVTGDPYDFPGLPRGVVKAWCVQTLGTGSPIKQWGGGTDPEVRKVKPRAVWEALRPRYPFLADLPALLPPGTLAGLPDDWHGWAAGQWVVQLEATIIARAIADLGLFGIVALPVHDSLIVQTGQAMAAVRTLEAAFREVAGIVPRIDAA